MRLFPKTTSVGSIIGTILLGCLWLGFSAMMILGRESSITIAWTTHSEIDTAGFMLYRINADTGESTVVTESMIPSTGEPMAGGEYQFVDRSVVQGERYTYQLEEVAYNDSRTIIREADLGLPGLSAIQIAVILIFGSVGLLFIGLGTGRAITTQRGTWLEPLRA